MTIRQAVARGKACRPLAEGLERRELLARIGDLDPSFGAGGLVSNPVGGGVGFTAITAVYGPVDQSPTVLAAGLAVRGGVTTFAVESLRSDGTLNPGFGQGGVLTIPIPAGYSPAEGLAHSRDRLVQADETALVATVVDASGVARPLIAQFSRGGVLDPQFGPGRGVVVVDAPNFVAADATSYDGILLVGTVGGADPGSSRIGLAHVSKYGTLVSYFGEDGLATLTANAVAPGTATGEAGASVAVGESGRIVVVGQSTAGVEVFRVDAGANLDTTFGGTGLVVLPATAGLASALAVGVDPNFPPDPLSGAITIVGDGAPAGGDFPNPTPPGVVARLLRDGTFAGSATFLPASQGVIVDAATVGRDGGFLVGGAAQYRADGTQAPGTGGPFFVARYLPGFEPDPLFGTNGQVFLTDPAGAAAVAPSTNRSRINDVEFDIAGNPILVGGSALPGPGNGTGTTLVARLRGGVATTAPTVPGQAGVLDPAFGSGGVFQASSTAGPPGFAGFEAVATLADGRVVAAGPLAPASGPGFGLVRLGTDGRPDPSFGSGGVATVTLPAGSTPATHLSSGFLDPAHTASLLVQPDGKLVFEGAVNRQGLPSSTIVARFNPDGTLDATFGAGGVVRLDQALGSSALAPDGKLVLAGTTPIPGFPNFRQIAAVRLDASGSPDPTFGGNGMVILSTLTQGDLSNAFGASSQELATAVAVLPDGRVLLAGYARTPNTSPPDIFIDPDKYSGEVFRLNLDGTLDAGFGRAGRVGPDSLRLNTPTALVVEPDGRIVLAGDVARPGVGTGPGVVERLNPDGSVAGFNSNLDGFFAASIARQPDGKLVVTGGGATVQDPDGAFKVVRLDPDLNPDPSFGSSGAYFSSRYGMSRFNVDVPNYVDYAATARAVALTPAGQIILVGSESSTNGLPTVSIVARLTGVAPAPPPLPPPAVTNDYTGDRKADLAIYLPAYGAFAIRPSDGGADRIVPFGFAGLGLTIPAPGDFDGSGRAEVAAYLPSLGVFAYRPSGGGPDVITPFGIPGVGQTIPAPGRYDGSGRTDIAAYLPAFGVYAYRPATGPDVVVPFGIAGLGQSIPDPGDYDGDGKTDLAVYLTAFGTLAYRPSGGGPDVLIPFGIAGPGQSIPTPGDFDGDGRTDVAAYLPALGIFAYRPSRGGPDAYVPFGIPGPGRTIPAVGDYTGAGRDEVAAYLPDLGVFADRPSPAPDVVTPFGVPGAGGSVPVTVVPATPQGPATLFAASVPVPPAGDDLAPITARKKAKGPVAG